MSKNRVSLGDIAKDAITGFSGKITAETSWLNGCRRLLIQPMQLNDKGQPAESDWFDDHQVVLVKDGEGEATGNGGPQADPVQCEDPQRSL